jgi:crotonobetainyl-CoA:carnitine CoA-transferase CaiB-like acyl-CoA transferase
MLQSSTMMQDDRSAGDSTLSALGDLRVLELSRVLAGPWAAQTLADLGADVIKVEHPERGDDTRGWGPPHLHAPDESGRESAYYLSANRNKRSVAINFSCKEGADLVLELARDSDILIENFRPGALAKHGLDYERVRVVNPRLVYCSITAFGQTGPARHRPGYDFAMQAMGGLMSLTGQPDGTPGAGPMKTGVAVTDLFAGLYSAIGILAAVHSRCVTGTGQHLDLSLFDSQVAMLANQASNYLVSGAVPQRLGNSHPNVVPYQSFATSDGHIVVAVGSDAQFSRCCRCIERADLADDARFRANHGRVQNRDILVAELAKTFRARDSKSWLAILEAADIPCAPINRLNDVFAEPQAIARGLRIELPHPFGTAVSIANPIRLSDTPACYRRAPPLLGQHTEEILTRELGLDAYRIEELQAQGIIHRDIRCRPSIPSQR